MRKLVAAVLALGALLTPITAIGATPPTYTNPVTAGVSHQFADPSVIRGRDGYWYGYATNGTRAPGDERHLMMIARSTDLVNWEYVGDVFTPETAPTYDGRPADVVRQFWAPSIEYFAGRYLLYYSYVINNGDDRSWRAIGVATASHPAGPWTDSGRYVTGPETWEPRPGVTGWRNVIDPDVFTAPDGRRYLYYGSVNGGVQAVQLSGDGLRTIGTRVQITAENRYEAAYIVHRGGWYYQFLSVIGGCCAGPASAYPVVVARSRNPLGPFVDRNGHPIAGRYGGGTPVQVPNGNQWVSPGHNAVATDLSGQDWLVTHGIDKGAPYAGPENARGLVISRLDWIDGWPIANAGRGLEAGPTPGPATDTLVADAVTGPQPSDVWQPAAGWSVGTEPAGGYLRTDSPGMLTSVVPIDGDVRARASVRLNSAGRAGLVLASDDLGRGLRVLIDADRRVLRIEARSGSGVVRSEASLPKGFWYHDWHELTVERRGNRVHAEVSNAGLYDPVAQASLVVPGGLESGPLALVAEGNETVRADFDDVTAAPLFQPVTVREPDPVAGAVDPAYSDEFARPLGPEWRWVRPPAATVGGGRLTFPVQTRTLVDARPKSDDDASVLLRDPPPGTWTAEAKVTVPFGGSLPYGWPMAGLIAYADDDQWVVLGSATRVDPRYASFGTEQLFDGAVSYGYAAIGPVADTLWLRLRHQVDPVNGEHEYQAAISVNGTRWTWYGARTLRVGPQPAIGLVAMDRDDDPTGQTNGLAATFDYFRIWR
ncbi:family 43 glycosylhydrolase [Kribbella sp. CA-247076]|uniref:family 43 glycosylhydrolase n=1 Tax=Kribbella sp. CA-247076 TaxID=3239941 RepID=UPI003D8D6A61